MALKLDDLLSKKKDPHSQILDLSKVRIRNREEFEKYFDKIPEYKIRPEKVRQEDIRIRETDFSFRYTKKEAKYISKHTFSYADPVPASMKTVRLDDLAAVDISWRMLTMLRPKNRLEEEIFSRLVELGKLRLATRKFEAKLLEAATSGAPGSQQHAIMASMGIIIIKTKRGGTETRIKTCKECGDELCTGALCKEFPYESYTRMILDKDELERQEAEEAKLAGVSSRRGSKNKAGNNGNNPKQVQGKPAKPATGAKLKGTKLKRKKKKRGKKGKTTKGSSESNSDAE
ncbi:hypothetical protein Ocin01_03854 [Orchesella cincta]|uniref:Uncharacterized protein n=1 Tax=Orchesella cincta TaxID=48709 RepID=A0A1D2NC55_ORCCI|nr:hypothetical protein Ocin01_03854 [Orchesella cincta]